MSSKSEFEFEMSLGSRSHANNNYLGALTHRLKAFSAEPPRTYDRGRAARDISATLDRLGDYKFTDSSKATNQEIAGAYAEYAYREHKELSENDDLDATREFSVSAMYVAISSARQDEGDNALKFVREAWGAGQKLWDIYSRPHQYDVNMIGRVVGIEGLYGPADRGKLRHLGKLAIELAEISQTTELLGANRMLSESEIKREQHKAKIRGYTARTIAKLQQLPTRNITKPVSTKLLKIAVL